jgi:GH25 family lysozyme M1 (1,4-beta-N-acetylmuramidase)
MRMPLLLTCLVVLAAGLVLAAPAGTQTYAKGVDVSNWQATVDWLQVGDDGYTFMFAKASEGTTFTDITYPVNRAGALGV